MNEVGKIVILGDSTTGKSCLVHSLLSPGLDVSLKYTMTIGVQTSAKVMKSSLTDDPAKLLFLDCTGLDLYHGILSNYWNSPNMLLLVFDITSIQSFENLSQWIELARGANWKNKTPGPVAAAVFANKLDLKDCRIISYDKGKEFADKYQLAYFEGSTRTREGVYDVFNWFAEKWRQYCSNISKDVSK